MVSKEMAPDSNELSAIYLTRRFNLNERLHRGVRNAR